MTEGAKMLGRRVKLKMLEALRNPECRECPLHLQTQNVCVMGRGNVMAPIHLVGEAPGSAEAKYDKPFMGASGKELDRCLQEVGIADKVYISNACRCRPKNNEKPLKSEARICSELYLEPEMNIIQPKIVVLMGTTAMSLFVVPPFTRGEVIWIRGSMYITTWHPAYLLRTRKEPWETRLQFIKHLKVAKKVSMG